MTATDFDPTEAAAAVSLARTVIDKYGADADKPSVHLATALINGVHERDRLRAEIETLRMDAARYQRLRILGCAPIGTAHLATATVMRFTNLDAWLDRDIIASPSRGEAK